MNTKTNWKVGDWCFYQFDLKQISEVEGGVVTSVRDKYFSTSANNLNNDIFPISFNIEDISRQYKDVYDRIYTAGNRMNLNFPDIVRWLSSEWTDCARKCDDNDYISIKLAILDKFSDGVIERINSFKKSEVNGIKLFR